MLNSLEPKVRKEGVKRFKKEINEFKRLTESDFKRIKNNLERSETRLVEMMAYIRLRSLTEWEQSKNKKKWLRNIRNRANKTLRKIKMIFNPLIILEYIVFFSVSMSRKFTVIIEKDQDDWLVQ